LRAVRQAHLRDGIRELLDLALLARGAALTWAESSLASSSARRSASCSIQANTSGVVRAPRTCY
jgi:hypothetical protein